MTFFADHSGDATLLKWRLYFLNLPTPVYWTDCDIDIETTGGVCGTHRWTAQPITPGSVSRQPDGASASFKIADGDDALFPVIAVCNGAELVLAAIYEAGFLVTNKSAAPDEVLEVFSGRVDRAVVDSSNEDSVEFVLMPPAASETLSLPSRLISSLVRLP